MSSSACWVDNEGDQNNECICDDNDDEYGDADDDKHGDVDDGANDGVDDEDGGVEAAFQNYKTECWETQLAAIFLFNADGCGRASST